MFSLIIDNALLLLGIFGCIYGAWGVFRGESFSKCIHWLIAGVVTIIVIVLEHTLLIDLTLSGAVPQAQVLRNVGDLILMVIWLFVAYKGLCLKQ